MKNWTFGKRMAAGFGSVILIVVILGALAAVIMNQGSHTATILSRDYVKALHLVTDFQGSVADMRINITPYVMTGSPDRLKAVQTSIIQVNELSDKLTTHLKNAPSLSGPNQLVGPAVEKARAYQENVQTTIKAMESFLVVKNRTGELGPKWGEATNGLVARQLQFAQSEIKGKPTPEQAQNALQRIGLANEVRNLSLTIRFANTRGQAYRDIKTFETAVDTFKKAREAITELEQLLKDPSDIQALADIRVYLDDYEKSFVVIMDTFRIIDQTTQNRNVLAREVNDATDKLFDSIQDLTVNSTIATATQLNFGKIFICIGVVVALVVAIMLALLITRSTSGTLKRIIDQLSSGAIETASAADQLSSGSQTLAQGASEQAASLEETSASMEEMTSMTKRNAENATNAKTLTHNAKNAAEKAAADIASMSDGMKTVAHSSEELSEAMNQIQASSTAITQIMKTIDEIAFQTNILSINAAVEAARAGDAGSGFAVVADEVRALARRSADAAKETAKMIKESSDRSRQGVAVTEKVSSDLANMNKMAQQVNSSLQAIVGQVHQVDEVIAEIATACQEQSQGIGQVNIALNQMDKVTQSNAASAEESASAAEQVSAQAEEAKSAVNQLVTLIGGKALETAPPETVHSKTSTKPGKATKLSIKPSKINMVPPVRKDTPAQTSDLNGLDSAMEEHIHKE